MTFISFDVNVNAALVAATVPVGPVGDHRVGRRQIDHPRAGRRRRIRRCRPSCARAPRTCGCPRQGVQRIAATCTPRRSASRARTRTSRPAPAFGEIERERRGLHRALRPSAPRGSGCRASSVSIVHARIAGDASTLPARSCRAHRERVRAVAERTERVAAVARHVLAAIERAVERDVHLVDWKKNITFALLSAAGGALRDRRVGRDGVDRPHVLGRRCRRSCRRRSIARTQNVCAPSPSAAGERRACTSSGESPSMRALERRPSRRSRRTRSRASPLFAELGRSRR